MFYVIFLQIIIFHLFSLQLAKFQKKKSSTDKKPKKKKKKPTASAVDSNKAPASHPADGTNGKGDQDEVSKARISDDESIDVGDSSIASSDFASSSHADLISPVPSLDVSMNDYICDC